MRWTVLGWTCLACGAGPPPVASPAAPSPSPAVAAQPAPAENAAVALSPPDPVEDDGTTPLARSNRERMTNPATGQPYFESDIFDVMSALSARPDELPTDRYWG